MVSTEAPRRSPVGGQKVTCNLGCVPKREHDSCPQCGSVEIGTNFNRSETSGDPIWECHCTDCKLKWSEEA